MKKLKRFSNEEILSNENLRVRFYDYYCWHAGYKVVDVTSDEIVGYITFNQFMKLPVRKISSNYGIEEYLVVRK